MGKIKIYCLFTKNREPFLFRYHLSNLQSNEIKVQRQHSGHLSKSQCSLHLKPHNHYSAFVPQIMTFISICLNSSVGRAVRSMWSSYDCGFESHWILLLFFNFSPNFRGLWLFCVKNRKDGTFSIKKQRLQAISTYQNHLGARLCSL